MGQDAKSSSQLLEMVIYYKFNIRLIRINKTIITKMKPRLFGVKFWKELGSNIFPNYIILKI
jgi:hypothetical protein